MRKYSIHLLRHTGCRLLAVMFTIISCMAFTSRSNAKEIVKPHYLVVISLDGCRWDYPQWNHTPFFDAMAADGVSGAMIPSFPSKTFPNHYTLATGLYPDHHGIVANIFYDRSHDCVFDLGDSTTKYDQRYYGGEPIWLTAQRQGLKTAEIYWPGSDVAVGGHYADSYYNYDAKPQLTLKQRADRVVELLNESTDKRPRLIMAYFEQPDGNGHSFGPQGKPTRRAVVQMDSLMGALWAKIRKTPVARDVNLIVTSDHGMTSISFERTVPVMKNLKKEWIKRIDGDLPGQIYVNPGFADSVVNALKGEPHLKVWKRADIPAYLHFGTNEMIGDVVALPELGWLFTDKKVSGMGSHDYDPSYSDMHAMFRAVGPDFKSGYVKENHFRNVDLYSIMAHLLDIKPSPNDGDIREVEDIFR